MNINRIRDGPGLSHRTWYDVDKPKTHSQLGAYMDRIHAAAISEKTLVATEGEISVKDSGHRETEFGTMVRVILALADCHECGILSETITTERDHRLSAIFVPSGGLPASSFLNLINWFDSNTGYWRNEVKKIIDYLELVGVIYDESVAYGHPNKGKPPYPFTFEEFKDFIHQIAKDAGGEDDKYSLSGVMFETFVIPFFFAEKEYRLTIMYGQGSAWSLYTVSECEEWIKHVRKLYEEYKDEE